MMALSKWNELGTAQHFLECDKKDCERNCEYFCNHCSQRMCRQCRDEHKKTSKYKKHEVVIYQQRFRSFRVEKCRTHPTKDKDMLCEECQVQLCSKCATQKDHRGHTFIDLETMYTSTYARCREEISKLQQYYLPTSREIQRDINEDSRKIKKIMDSIRTSIKVDADGLKSLVDRLASENIQRLNNIEKSLTENLKSQEKEITGYISYLSDLDKELQKYLSQTKPPPFTSSISEKLKIRSIPELPRLATPVFTACQYNKDDVAKLLGKIDISDSNRENRHIESLETSTSALTMATMNPEDKRTKYDDEQRMILSSAVSKIRKFEVPCIVSSFHMSLDKSGRLWVSDNEGFIIQTDLQGNRLKKIPAGVGYPGFHTVSGVIVDGTISPFINTRDWKPVSIYSSHINGNLLVGMLKGRETKITRYSSSGKELQNFQKDKKGQNMYSEPHYIVENINGDICVSDYDKKAVVVVNKSGQHRFSYRGQKARIWPAGICTDVLSHILVCDSMSNTVHLLNQDGQFLSLLLTPQQAITNPRSVCVDDENNFYVGQWNTNIVTVFKYLQ
ncbi:uncharacterized protein LOC134260749 [Saccostrea cucullata]|uniref:uncharacterized protein LOC134260749 n=1 Tax=Saccostrea cuccullata TaxID=36930 RepID=UPI002ED54430